MKKFLPLFHALANPWWDMCPTWVNNWKGVATFTENRHYSDLNFAFDYERATSIRGTCDSIFASLQRRAFLPSRGLSTKDCTLSYSGEIVLWPKVFRGFYWFGTTISPSGRHRQLFVRYGIISVPNHDRLNGSAQFQWCFPAYDGNIVSVRWPGSISDAG